MDALHEKRKRLVSYLESLGSVAVAFSSGVDSTFLLKTAHDTLGEDACAVTVRSALFPERESREAKAFCKKEGIRQYFLDIDELSIPGFRMNPPDRCYICKKEIFSAVIKKAKEQGFRFTAEGSNLDDNGDYRPGLRAVRELGIKSPLREALLTKADIRALSREAGLPTWNKPSFACLASRFAYGEEITGEKLRMTELAEERLSSLGFTQFRVRLHGSMARIELLKEELPRLFEKRGTAEELDRYLRSLGFTFVTVDLAGYRTGSMNGALDRETLKKGMAGAESAAGSGREDGNGTDGTG